MLLLMVSLLETGYEEAELEAKVDAWYQKGVGEE